MKKAYCELVPAEPKLKQAHDDEVEECDQDLSKAPKTSLHATPSMVASSDVESIPRKVSSECFIRTTKDALSNFISDIPESKFTDFPPTKITTHKTETSS